MREVELLAGSQNVWLRSDEVVFLGWSGEEPIRVIASARVWYLLLEVCNGDETAARKSLARSASSSDFVRADAPRGYDVRVQRVAQLRSA